MNKIAADIAEALQTKPMMFADVLRQFKQYPYREILLAWSELRESDYLDRTRPEGGYRWKG